MFNPVHSNPALEISDDGLLEEGSVAPHVPPKGAAVAEVYKLFQ